MSRFNGQCFSEFLQRRKFIDFCKEEFKKFLILLSDKGFNLLILDNLDLNLLELESFNFFDHNLKNDKLKRREHKLLADIIKPNVYITNNPDIFKIVNPKVYNPDFNLNNPEDLACYIRKESNIIFIEIRESLSIHRNRDLPDDWYLKIKGYNKIPRLTLNCFCDFNDKENDFIGIPNESGYQSKGLVNFMQDFILENNERINNEIFDNSKRLNRFIRICENDGIDFNCLNYIGKYLILDEKFFILPEPVYKELLKNI